MKPVRLNNKKAIRNNCFFQSMFSFVLSIHCAANIYYLSANIG